MTQRQRTTVLRGGLDLVSPGLAIQPGKCIAALNYESEVRGYRRMQGYERYDGQPSPSKSQPVIISFTSGSTEPSVNDLVVGATSAAIGYIQEAPTVTSGTWGGGDAAGTVLIRSVVGTFVDAENLNISGGASNVLTLASAPSQDTGGSDSETEADRVAAVAQARALIAAVPGSGNIRGVATYQGNVYAWRDNVGATAGVMHMATSTGWTAVSFGVELAFTSASELPEEGDTIDGATSGASATVERVVLQSGDVGAGTGVGFLVLSGQTGNFSAENIDIDGGSSNVLSVAGDSTSLALPAGGLYRSREHNFYGAGITPRLYFCNGEGEAYEYDGTVLAPIRTGLSTSLEKPTHIAVHSNHLFLGYANGHIQYSGTGTPLSHLVVDGAGTANFGQTFTGFEDQTKDSLILTAKRKVGYLVGSDTSDFEIRELSEDSGAIEGTMQVIGSPHFLDDRGIRSMQAAETYGDWAMGSITEDIEPLLQNKKTTTTVVGSTRSRSKDQYRLFWGDKTGITIYFGREVPEILPFMLEFTPCCVTSGEGPDGNEILFAGGTDGYVYQLDAGTSADGSAIEFYARLSFLHQGYPEVQKRYHNALFEMGDLGTGTVNITANYGYGGVDNLAGSGTLLGSGGFWDTSFFDQIIWDSVSNSSFSVDLRGVAKNISLVISGSQTDEEPHVISAVTLSYTMRRQLR